MKNIRNFSIIAHIDHGKSTLADRLIQYTGVVTSAISRTRSSTTWISSGSGGSRSRARPITLPYRAKDGKDYVLNLIDTPGHVDFSYEVSRSLASCEGVLLLIDAAQGVQAQTIANLYLAMENNLEIIPVINKIDLPSADVERVLEQIDSELGLDPFSHIKCSAKEGIGIEEILEAIVEQDPAPKGDPESRSGRADLRRPVRFLPGDGHPLPGLRRSRQARGHHPLHVQQRHATRWRRWAASSSPGKRREDSRPATWVTSSPGSRPSPTSASGTRSPSTTAPATQPLPGFKEVKPVVFSSIYPIASDDYEDLAVSLEKYKLNDASFVYQKDSSAALGQGFRCGFLGLLHLDIVQERLEREYDLSIILSVPASATASP